MLSLYSEKNKDRGLFVVINFILVEDNRFFHEILKNIIDEYMAKIKIDYTIYSFFDYTNEVYEIINDDTILNKIYILDIVCPSNSGTSAATEIRKNDIKSFVIFITNYYNQYQQVMLANYFMFLAFINKKKNYKKELCTALNIGTKAISDTNIVRINHGSLKLTLEKKDILYVNIKNRRTYIVTSYQTFDLAMSLQELFLLLGKGFMYCHKSIIVNTSQIKNIDSKNREICFDEEHYVVASKALIKNITKEFNKICIKK